jgi:hypothetical protein
MSIRGKKMNDEEIEVHRNWYLRFLTNRIIYALHLFTYIMVNGLLIMIWLVSWMFTGLTYFWPFHSLFGWGFGLGFHVLTYIMYNDKSEYLTHIRDQSPYIMTFTYHTFFYISINLYLFLINLIDLTFIWFTWSLGMWGIAYGYHAIGYFTWNKIFDEQWKKLRPKYDDFSKKRLKHEIIVKIGNFWLLLVHLTYYIVTFIIVNVYVFVGMGLGELAVLIITEIFLSWGIFLAWHVFGYILFYHVESIKVVIKGFILHITFYVILNIQIVMGYLIFSRFYALFPWEAIIYLLLLSAVGILIHALITAKWDYFLEKAQTKVNIKYGEAFHKDEVRLIAKRIIFWRWSLITHFLIYIVSLVIIGVNITNQGLDFLLLIHPAMGWLIGVAFHAAIYYLYSKRIKGFFSITALLHTTVYIITSIYLVILNILFLTGVPWSLFAILGWGIGLGIHLLIMYSTRKRKQVTKERVSTKEMALKWSFIIHLFVYMICLGIIGIALAIQGQNLLLLIHPTMGWLIAVAGHGAIYVIVKKPIKGFLIWSAFLHLIIYIVVSFYLVILNVLFSPGFPWSSIAIAGWGIGIGLHLLLVYLTKK